MTLDPASEALVRLALAEDLGNEGDVTTQATVSDRATGRALLVAKHDAVLAGTEAFDAVFREVDPPAKVVWESHDGDRVRAGTVVARIEGSLRTILTAERTALNFVQRLSGVATLTRRFVEAAPDVQIRDTRKTTPGMRALERDAVRAGGGTNHRMGLYDAILIKDNHVAAAGGVVEAIERARAARPDLRIEVECETVEDVRAAVHAGTDEILLDNMTADELREAVRVAGTAVVLEASGGVTLESVREIAATGVHAISAGALTHSAPAIDFSIELEPEPEEPDAPRG